MTDGTKRADIQAWLKLAVMLKQAQRTAKLTESIVRDIPIRPATHPQGDQATHRSF
ncbi:conserved hypothetical protein [delta proteobacterium NaphS2]|nr:conserved hypothetical protein [delta proteobacterium NaphS2]